MKINEYYSSLVIDEDSKKNSLKTIITLDELSDYEINREKPSYFNIINYQTYRIFLKYNLFSFIDKEAKRTFVPRKYTFGNLKNGIFNVKTLAQAIDYINLIGPRRRFIVNNNLYYNTNVYDYNDINWRIGLITFFKFNHKFIKILLNTNNLKWIFIGRTLKRIQLFSDFDVELIGTHNSKVLGQYSDYSLKMIDNKEITNILTGKFSINFGSGFSIRFAENFGPKSYVNLIEKNAKRNLGIVETEKEKEKRKQSSILNTIFNFSNVRFIFGNKLFIYIDFNNSNNLYIQESIIGFYYGLAFNYLMFSIETRVGIGFFNFNRSILNLLLPDKYIEYTYSADTCGRGTMEFRNSLSLFEILIMRRIECN